MSASSLRVVVLGLSLSSSWGNGHATTWRGLLKALAARGHDVTFLERDTPWYAAHRDLAEPDFCRLVLYPDLAALEQHRAAIGDADLVIVGSYVPEGVAVGRLVQETARGIAAFYDIDTPVTLAKLDRGDFEYIAPDQIPGYDLYLSFTGGPTLERLESRHRSPAARALYCSVDPEAYPALERQPRWDLSYIGTWSSDRQPKLERLLFAAARKAPHLDFIVAGPQYPDTIHWPPNVERITHIPPADHPAFYAASRFTLNLTRADMVEAGYSPSVRLFEAAACATPILSDAWEGLDACLTPGEEIALVETADQVVDVLTEWSPDRAGRMAEAARRRVLGQHTARHRAEQLEREVLEVLRARRGFLPSIGSATSPLPFPSEAADPGIPDSEEVKPS